MVVEALGSDRPSRTLAPRLNRAVEFTRRMSQLEVASCSRRLIDKSTGKPQGTVFAQEFSSFKLALGEWNVWSGLRAG